MKKVENLQGKCRNNCKGGSIHGVSAKSWAEICAEARWEKATTTLFLVYSVEESNGAVPTLLRVLVLFLFRFNIFVAQTRSE